MPHASLPSAIRHAALLLGGLLAVVWALQVPARSRTAAAPPPSLAEACFDSGAALRFLPSPLWLPPAAVLPETEPPAAPAGYRYWWPVGLNRTPTGANIQ